MFDKICLCGFIVIIYNSKEEFIFVEGWDFIRVLYVNMNKFKYFRSNGRVMYKR